MKQILVVEDEDQTRRSLSTVLESAGYKVLDVKNGLEAKNKLLKNKPGFEEFDLILTDIFMPAMTGIELIDLLKKQGCFLPVVVISGYLDDRLKSQLSKRGCSKFINKPFEPNVLLDCVANMFDPGVQ